MMRNLVGVGVLMLLSSCLGSLPTPPIGPSPADAMVEVPYPPPPARAQTVPPRPKDGDLWVEGQWDWDGKAWKWLDGSWMPPRTNAYFSPWTTERRRDGRLFFARAAWRTKDGRALDRAPARESCAAPSTTSPAAVQGAK
jgi:hypothetical protein